MKKIDIDKTIGNMTGVLIEMGRRPDANALLYCPEGIAAIAAFTRWALALEGRVDIDTDQLINAASGIATMPLANMLASMSGDDKENLHAGVHFMLDRLSYDLHRLTATFDGPDARSDDPDMVAITVAKRDVGDA